MSKNKPTMNMIGGGFQHAFSSCGWEHPQEIVWDKTDHRSDISVYIDDAILQPPQSPLTLNVAWFCESPYFMKRYLDMIRRDQKIRDYLEAYYLHVFCSYKDLIAEFPDCRLKYIHPHARPWVEDKQIFPKTQVVSMIASNKNEAPGHKLRHEIAKAYGDQIEIFGSGYTPVKSKNEGLNDYMFSFAIENIDSPGYFTEKITDCFATGTIPIYWGDPTIADNFCPEGIVFLNDDFDGSVLTKEFYESKMSYIEENFKRATNLPFPEDEMYLKYLK